MDAIEQKYIELSALHKLDEVATQYQQQGNYVRALETMNQALVLRQNCFGTESKEVQDAAVALTEMYNLLSMTYLQQGQSMKARECLRKAEHLSLKGAPRLMTLNNLACYYRHQGQLENARSTLNQALALSDDSTKAETHLNMCAVQSQQGKHQEARTHAHRAVRQLQEELFHQSFGPLDAQRDRVTVLILAYHNLGVEEEHQRHYTSSLEAYEMGWKLARQYLGRESVLTRSLHLAYIGAKEAHAKEAKNEPSGQNTKVAKQPKRRMRKKTTAELTSVPKLNEVNHVHVVHELKPDDPFFSPRNPDYASFAYKSASRKQ